MRSDQANDEQSIVPTGARSFADRARREALSTYGPRVMKLTGAFAGLFRLDYDEKIFQRNYRNPVLVAARADGGSRVRADLARRTSRLADLAVDAVASCANDMLTIGAEPLLALQHVSGDLSDEQHGDLIEGLATGCRQAGCALLGSDQPSAASAGEGLDLSVFAVGVCDHKKLITGGRIEPDDEIIGLAGNVLHGTGIDVAAEAALEGARLQPETHLEDLGCTVGEALLVPTASYVTPVLRVLRYYRRKRIVPGMAHVREGGLPAAIEAILPAQCRARIDTEAWPEPPIVARLRDWGVPAETMWQTFNMGIGYVLIVRPTFTQSILKQLRRRGVDCWRIGEIGRGPREVAVEG